MRVLLTDRPWADSRIESDILSQVGAEVQEASSGSEAELVELARDADAIATCWAQVTAPVIQAAKKCRIVSRLGIGLDNIAVETATELGIPVTNVPDYCVAEVADHTIALLLAISRKIAFYHSRTKAGEYQLQAGPPMRRLSNQVLGLIGLGRIGQLVVPRARALGLHVVAHTSSGNDYGTGCPMVTLRDLLQQSDFVSLHAPLTPDTRQLLGPAEFELMKPTASIINTSRGGLINQTSLWAALQKDAIAGVGLDVFEPEPPDLSQPLFRDERVIVTPHAAFVSEESLVDLRTRAAHQIAQALQGKQPEYVVNPQAYDNAR